MPVITLRPVADADLDALFDQMRDPESVRMAAFAPGHPDDRSAFDAHMARVRSSPDITLRAVTCDGRLVGSAAAYVLDGETEVTYWIDRAAWGRGFASRALELLMDLVPARPLHARTASDMLARSGSSRNPVFSRSSERDLLRARTGRATSRKPSCGRTSAQAGLAGIFAPHS